MNQSMEGLIRELFESNDLKSGMLALEQQADKGDVEAALTLGFYYVYGIYPAVPEKAFYYLDRADKQAYREVASLVRAMYYDSPYGIDLNPMVIFQVSQMMEEMVGACSLQMVKHMVWLKKRFHSIYSGKAMLKRLDELMPTLSDASLYEARLLYAELLSLPGLVGQDLRQARIFWRGLLTGPIRYDTAQRALYMHFLLHSELLSEQQVVRLINQAEQQGYNIALLKGYWQLSDGALAEAYQTFEKGYAQGEQHCELAMAYCLSKGYGTRLDVERALSLCDDPMDKVAELMKARIQLLHRVDRLDEAWAFLEEQGLEKLERQMITELLLQRHVYYGTADKRLRQVVESASKTGVPLAFLYAHKYPGEYPYVEALCTYQSTLPQLADCLGSHALNDYQLALSYHAKRQRVKAARYFLRGLYNPNASLAFRKLMGQEVALHYASLSDGKYFQRVLDWWANLDPRGDNLEHRLLVWYADWLKVKSEAAIELFQALKEECESGSERIPFVYHLIGLVLISEKELYNLVEAVRFLRNASQMGCYFASEKLLFDHHLVLQDNKLDIPIAEVEAELYHSSGPYNHHWLASQTAGFGFPML